MKRKATNHVDVNIRRDPDSGSCSGQGAGWQRAQFQDDMSECSIVLNSVPADVFGTVPMAKRTVVVSIYPVFLIIDHEPGTIHITAIISS